MIALMTKWHALRRLRTFRWVAQAMMRRWLGLVAVTATMLGGVGITLLQPWPMKILVDNVLSDEPLPPGLDATLARLALDITPNLLLTIAVASTLLLFLAGWTLALAHTIAKIAYSQRMAYDLSAYLFGHLQRLSLRYHSRKSVGDSIRRVTSDTGFIATIIQGALLPSATAVLTLAGMFLIMWSMSPQLTLVSVAVVPLMAAGFVLYANRMLERSYAQQSAEGRIYDVVEQALSAMPVVQAFAQEERNERRLRGTTDAALRAAVASADIDLRFKIAIGVATALGTGAVLWFGARQVLAGQLTLGGLLVFLAYLASFYAPLNTLMYSSSTVQAAAGSARRVMEVLEAEEEVEERPTAVELGRVRGRVELQGVVFGYEAERPVLQDVSVVVEPGQTLALVGATGAGKSTLVGLVPRFFDPWQGRVLIDGIDVRDVTLKSLRGQVSLVLQEPFLFPMSVADNIAYGRPGATRQEVEAAARAANAHEFISRLAQGYDTVIGERGATLSGGERQRVAIARALLKDAPILILDEPTSALDVETEGLVLEALERLMAGRTTLIIAHRFTTIRNADQVVVLEHGRVVEAGTHEALIGTGGGVFRRLHVLQSAAAACESAVDVISSAVDP
jgi:ATP-binding cassette, subfamily B, bacterial